MRRLFSNAPMSSFLSFICAVFIAAFLVMRGDRELMAELSEKYIQPLHRAMAQTLSSAGFSVAELLIAIGVVALLWFTVKTVSRFLLEPGRIRTLWRYAMTLLAAFLLIYAGFCALWGIYYYGDDFMSKSGLDYGEVSTEELTTVTRYFAGLANQYSRATPRDENGLCRSDRDAILRRSPEVYDNIVKEFPCLDGPRVAAKGVFCSKVMSLLDFTGFFFPFTGEANVNTDSPEAFFASTVAHELAHQRGVAKEQEANFCAVLASFEYGDSDYCYSAALMGYVHLSNALYSADREAWQQIRDSLDREVTADLQYNSEYWAKYDTKVKDISNTVYEDFLESYGQELGLRSYGACVDLLVNRYYDTAVLALSAADSYSREP